MVHRDIAAGKIGDNSRMEKQPQPTPETEPTSPGWRLQHRNWTLDDEPGWLIPGRRGAVPGPWLVLDPPLANRFHLELRLTAAGIDVLRIRCRSKGPEGLRRRDVYVAIAPPGALHHDLDRAEFAFVETPEGVEIHLVLSGDLEPGETLREIALDPVTALFAEASSSPAMRLRIDDVCLLPVIPDQPPVPFAASRRLPSPQPLSLCAGRGTRVGGAVAGASPRLAEAPRPSQRERGGGEGVPGGGEGTSNEAARENPRDAVLFAWWVPDHPEARKVGEYYLGLLRYHHPDSRIFLGVNHGSDPALVDAVAASGLDVEICPVPPEIAVTSDSAGFLAALAAFQRSDEPFDLVWFGHTKGASQPRYADYLPLRFDQERRFWSRRAAMYDAFRDPHIGVAAMDFIPPPTYPFPPPWQGWSGELAALRRVYRDRLPPLGLNALDTFFVLRAGIVRAFCAAVGADFFHIDPHEYGASRWFFEMAFPSIASMQGYEPFLPSNVPGAGAMRDDILLDGDIRQHHRLCREEVQRWREDPANFRPRVLPWDRPAWQQR